MEAVLFGFCCAFKLLFIGAKGHGLRRLRTFLKKGSKNSKNF